MFCGAECQSKGFKAKPRGYHQPHPNRGVPATGDLILTAFGEAGSVGFALILCVLMLGKIILSLDLLKGLAFHELKG